MKQRHDITAALDLGSSKITCIIAQSRSGGPVVLGAKHLGSKGYRNGNIVDLEALQHGIATTIHEAEQAAGITLERITVSISCPQINAQTHSNVLIPTKNSISESDLNKLQSQALQAASHTNQTIIHAIPLAYQIDDDLVVSNPKGMLAHKIVQHSLIIALSSTLYDNIHSCISRCHLDLTSLTISPYASSFSCLTDDELEQGSILIDMGGDTTSFSLFEQQKPMHIGVIPVGGNHVTSDISHVLEISLKDAERIKTLHGHALMAEQDHYETIMIRSTGEYDEASTTEINRSSLIEIMQPRLEETFSMLAKRIRSLDPRALQTHKIILTGSASQLPGIKDLAHLIFKQKVRIALPQKLRGLEPAFVSPGFSSVVGTLLYGSHLDTLNHAQHLHEKKHQGHRLKQITQWIRENF